MNTSKFTVIIFGVCLAAACATAHEESKRPAAETKAAEGLAKFDASKCREMSSPSPSACPALNAASAEEIPEGARLGYESQAAADASFLEMKCFITFARGRQNDGGDKCPLTVPNVDVRIGLVAKSVELVALTEPDRTE